MYSERDFSVHFLISYDYFRLFRKVETLVGIVSPVSHLILKMVQKNWSSPSEEKKRVTNLLSLRKSL